VKKPAIFLFFILSIAIRTQGQTANCTTVVDWLQKASITQMGTAGVWIQTETQQWDYVCKTTGATNAYPANTQYFGPGSVTTTAHGSGTVTNGDFACNPKWTAIPFAPYWYSINGKSGSDYLQVNSFDGVYYTTGPYPVINNCDWYLDQSEKGYCAAQPCKAPASGSPIVIDLDRKGFFLTSAEEGVRFDLAGSGKPVQIAWIAWGARNAFLVLPGPDGRVTTGKEMFGNYTPQPEPPPGYQRNGFNALKVYDANNDGVIDSKDPIFKSLRLWIGRPDAHGSARPEDLYTLAELGVNSISLAYHNDKYVDSYGNQFRYVSEANPDKADAVNPLLYDVWLVEACTKGN
jgi:hypothetical protein